MIKSITKNNEIINDNVLVDSFLESLVQEIEDRNELSCGTYCGGWYVTKT